MDRSLAWYQKVVEDTFPEVDFVTTYDGNTVDFEVMKSQVAQMLWDAYSVGVHTGRGG